MSVKYKIIADTLEKEIEQGKYSDTNKMPTEAELGNRFEVSRNTIRKAIEILVKKGIAYQVQGSGAFIRESLGENFVNLQNMNGLTKDFADKTIETKVLDFKLIKADEKIANKMKCEVGTDIYFVNRLRTVDGWTYTVEYSYFNKDLILYLNKDIIKGSIYNYIREDLKLTIGLVERIFYADTLSDIDAKLLKLEKGGAALINENVAKLNTGEIFDYSVAIVNSKNVKFTFLSNLK